MNPTLSKVLGGAQMGLGLIGGNPNAVSSGYNRMTKPQPDSFNYWAANNANPRVPTAPITQPTAPVISAPQPPGFNMAQPGLFAPGAKSQIDATGMSPNRPGFKFPSAMYTDSVL